MQNWLLNLWLNPQSSRYKVVQWLNQHLILGLSAICLIFIGLPLIYWGIIEMEYQHQSESLSELQQHIAQQQRLFLSLKQQANKASQFSQQIPEINQQIKQKIAAQRAQIAQLQWHIEQQQLTLVVHQKTDALLALIAELQKIPRLQFQDLTLSKLHRQRLVELHARLQITTQSKGE